MQQCEEFNDVIVIACQFISGVGKYYNQLEMVAEMGTIRKFLEIAFSGFVKDADQALVTNSNSSAVRTAFELSGKLVKHCAKAIYSKVYDKQKSSQCKLKKGLLILKCCLTFSECIRVFSLT